jgi:hypothetical protein
VRLAEGELRSRLGPRMRMQGRARGGPMLRGDARVVTTGSGGPPLARMLQVRASMSGRRL